MTTRDTAQQGELFANAEADGPFAGLTGPADAASPVKPANGRKPRLVLLDGHAMVFRAFFALSREHPMTVKQTGERVEAVYSFISTLFKAINNLHPTHLAIAFDPPGGTFRHDDYSEYKANRPPTPDEFPHQLDRVKQVVKAMGMPIYEVTGYEADDVLGSIAHLSDEQGIETVIFTGDTDTLQLVSPHVSVLITSGFGDQRTYDEAAVRERYGGLEPRQQIDVKALEGDPSDNIKGVPGVGRKTAIKLIQDHGSVEGIYERIDKVSPPRIQGLLREHEAAARKSKYLVTIVTDMTTGFSMDDAHFGDYRREDLVALFRDLGFGSLVERIPVLGDESTPPPALSSSAPVPTEQAALVGAPNTATTVVDTATGFKAMLDALAAAEAVSIATESSAGNPMEADLAGIELAIEPGHAYYVPVGHAEGGQLPLATVLHGLLPLLGAPKMALVGHSLNHDLTLLARHGLAMKSVRVCFDTMLGAHLLGERGLGLKQLVLARLGFEMTAAAELTGTGRKLVPLNQLPIADVAAYAGAKADMALRLKALIENELDERSLAVARDIELPLVPVIVQMQVEGIALDASVLEELDDQLRVAIAQAEAAIYSDVGHEFNIGSPQQLSDILFKELHLRPGKRTQTGYSTDASTLEALVDTHSVIRHILEYRELTKLKSTYVDALPQQVNSRTHRIHTTFNQAGAATGRLASNDPNLQNIPVRTELGRRVRKAFVAEQRPEWTLLAADYSQVELRVLAHLSGDHALIEAFERGEDIHTSTASMVYKVPLEEVTGDMRRLAKVMNFGVIYGLSAFGIANQTELTMEEGTQFIDTYLGTYPRVKEYLEETIHRAREMGYVETMLGRRRYVPEITSLNRNLRLATERIVVNMPVQGTAADIIKAAMIDVAARLDDEGLNTKMLLQVHDELVFELPVIEEARLRALLEEIMPAALDLVVPLKIDIKTGPSWGDMEVALPS
jgi:DNA polymerase-1